MPTDTKRQILVVDDDADFTAYLKTILEQDGYKVATASDGEEALKHVRTTPPDLVTLDIQMPRKTGVLFYRQMKSDGGLRSIPVVVISGLFDEGNKAFIERFFEGDHIPAPEAYLAKPVAKERLLAVVKEKLTNVS
jgi:CheY-like chemotaxis protein